MKNKVVRKLLMVGLSSSVVLTSTVGVTAASMDATTTDVVVENAAEDEVLTPVEGEEAVTEETSEEVAEEETTEETGEEVAEEETTEETVEAETRTIYVSLIDADTKIPVGNENIQIQIGKDDTTFHTDMLTLPEGYEVANRGDVYVGTGDTVNVEVRTIAEAETRTIYVSLIDADTKIPVGNENIQIQIGKDDTTFHTDMLTLPEGYEVANRGDVYVGTGDSVNVEVRKIVENRTIYVGLIDADTKIPLENGNIQIQIGKDDTTFHTDMLTLPKGYEVANRGDVYVGTGDSVNVEVRKTSETRTIYVSLIDGDSKIPLENGILQIQIGKDDTTFHTDRLILPEDYEVCNTGDVYVGTGDTVNVEVRKVSENRTVYVSYIEEETNIPLENGIQKIQIGKTDTTFHTDLLTAPEGWVLCSTGDVYVGKNDTVNVYVRRAEAETRTVYVSYIEEETNIPLENGIEEIQIGKDATTFHTDLLTAPKGWELCSVGDVYVGENDTVNVYVRKAVAYKNIIVNYVLEDGSPVLSQDLIVAKEATYINTSSLNVPAGYELVIVGDLSFNANNTLTVKVRAKEYTKDVIVNYVDEVGKPVLTTSIKLPENATYFNTSILKDVPYGWVIAVVGDMPIDENNTATVVVRPKTYTKDVAVNYVDANGTTIATSSVTLEDTATYFNTSILTGVPEGWEIANIGDVYVGNADSVDVLIRETVKREKDIIISYVDEKDGHEVAVSSITIDEDASYFNTSLLTDVPEGWTLAEVGDIYLGSSTVAKVKIRQVEAEQRNITVKYVTEDGEEVGTGALVVDENDTYINTSILTDVPEGYVIAIVGDLPIEDDTVVVTVRAEKEDPEEPTPTPDPENPTPTPDPEDPTPTPNPEDPDQPVDPENPTPTPDQNKPTVAPEKPNNNNQNNNQTTTDTDKSEVKTNNPKTGDATNTVPLVAGLLGSGSMIGLIQMLRRKKK